MLELSALTLDCDNTIMPSRLTGLSFNRSMGLIRLEAPDRS